MIEVLEKVKQAYDKSTIQIDRIIVDNNPYRITNADYNDDCYENGNIFGTAIARMLEFEIENSINLEKKEFEYQTGIYIDDKIFWISLGNFIVQDVEPNNTTNKNKVTSMDYMLKSNIKYNSKLDYKSGKITILDVVKEGCQQSGLELATTDFANSDFIVDSNQFSEDTLIRQVFQAAAQMSGTFAKIRSDNKLYFITPKRKGLLVKEVHKMTVAELNKLPVEKLAACENNYSLSSYKELIVKRNTHPINLVSLGMSDIEGENITLRDEESIAKDGENSLVINDNPFAYTQEKREQLITALFNVIKGFEYTAFEITGQAKPYIETGDEVVAKDKEGNLNHSFLFRFRYRSPNGLESEMSAPSITKATVNYQNVPNATDIAKRTELIVDKQNQTITGLIDQQSETTQKLSEHEQTIEGFKDTVSDIKTDLNENYSTTEQMQSLIEQEADNIELSVSKKVDNIQVGGTNLLPNSAPYTLEHWIRLDASQVEISLEDEETAPFKKCVRMRLLEKPTGNMGVYIVPTCKTLKQGQEYSFSVWLKSTANTNNVTVGYLKGGQKTVNITTEWQKVTHTFIADAPTSETHGFVIYAPAGTTSGRSVYIHSAKLEEGNKATAWSPAPEDDVKGHEIISKINMSPEDVTIQSKKISLEGYTTINEGFSIDEKGNASIANGNVIIDNEGIKLAEGTSIVNANGLYTNLQFISGGLYSGTYGGQYSLLGIRRIYDYDTGITFGTDDLLLDVFIPSNFVINKAILTLMHSAEDWSGYDDITSKDYNCVGYVRNIKLYRTTSNYKMQFTMGGDLVIVGLDGLSEISNAFGTNGYTCGADYRTAGKIERKDSIDISNSLKSGYQKLVLRTTQTANNVADAAAKTALAYAILNVYGYLNKI